ncbi:MAG: aspartate carbamoyltransferase regulatory subunit [archaeon]
MKELKVAAIDNGTVIDHIPAAKAFEVANILKLSERDDTTMIATNLPSKNLGKKGLIKISDRELTKKETNKIALVAPHATINIIKKFEVAEKRDVIIPDEIIGIVRCPNPNCVSNKEDMLSKFLPESLDPLRIRCHYCERVIDSDEIKVV